MAPRFVMAPWVASLIVFSFWMSRPSPAWAGLESCGNIQVQANARCTVLTRGGCDVQCKPLAVRAACAGRLQATCQASQCRADVDVNCAGRCEADCTGQCNVDPPAFDCRGSCEGRCTGDCAGTCQGKSGEDRTTCEASCKATCSGTCEGSCTRTPGQVDCAGRCQASCQGSCRARANLSCQVDCQARGMVSCTSQLEGGCRAQCSRPEGALFCDGNYVDTGDNLQKCIDALKAQLNITVTASGEAECAGNTCTAQGQASASCSLVDPGAPVLGSGFFAAGSLLGLGAFGCRRANRGRRKR